jgi:hypothetical protein
LEGQAFGDLIGLRDVLGLGYILRQNLLFFVNFGYNSAYLVHNVSKVYYS